MDLIPGDELVEGSVIQCHVENDEPKVSLYSVYTTVCLLILKGNWN